MVVFLAPLVEELLFRGLLLQRMRIAVGKRDWAAHGTLFTLYHVHQPWSMPATLLDGIFAAAYPTPEGVERSRPKTFPTAAPLPAPTRPRRGTPGAAEAHAA